jgi:hypothetical protein
VVGAAVGDQVAIGAVLFEVERDPSGDPDDPAAPESDGSGAR